MKSVTSLLYLCVFALLLSVVGTDAHAQSKVSEDVVKVIVSKKLRGLTLSPGEARILAAYEAEHPGALHSRKARRSQDVRARGGAELLISEIRTDDPGTDDDEYFELSGEPDVPLDGVTYLVIGDGTGGSGTIETVIDLAGQSLSADGFFVAINGSNTLGVTGDITLSANTFENSDNVTHLLVTGFTGANGDDLDSDDDGTLDATPWGGVLDAVSLVETTDTPAEGEFFYAEALGGETVGPNGTFVPSHIYRDGVLGTWTIGAFDPADGDDTPGAVNGTSVLPLEEEGFEGETFPPEGWASFDNGIGDLEDWQRVDLNGDGSNFVAIIGFEDVGESQLDCSVTPEQCAADWLATPQFTPTASANTLVFYAAQFFEPDFGSVFEVLVSTGSQTDPVDYTVVASYTEDDLPISLDLAPFAVDLAAYVGTPIYVAFVHRNDFGDAILLDDVRVTGMLEPVDLDAAGLIFQGQSAVAQGDTTAFVASLTVAGEEVVDPVTATSFTFTTEGTTADADLGEAILYFAGNDLNVELATLQVVGTPIMDPTGTLTFDGDVVLSPGDNFFVLAYVIEDEATPFNEVDATFTSVTVDGEAVTPDPSTLDGTITIAPAVPANDDVVEAIGIEPTDTVLGANVNATLQEGEPLASCSDFGDSNGDSGASVFYEVTAAATGFLTFDLRRSNYDTIVSIHDPSDLSELACNDDAEEPLEEGHPFASNLEGFPVKAGETFLVRVSGWTEGIIRMDVTFTPPGAAEVDAEELTISVETGETETGTITVSNTGDGPLEYSVSLAAARLGSQTVRHPRDQRGLDRTGAASLTTADGSGLSRAWTEDLGAPRLSYRGGGTSISHSASQSIVDDTGVACNSNATNFSAQNSYWRVFELSAFGLNNGFDVTSVDIGVQATDISGPIETTVNLYTLDGAFELANLTLMGSATYDLQPTDAMSIVSVPVTGSFGFGATLVVEWLVPDIRAGAVTGTVFFGGNSAGQTGPTYVSSATCDLNEPTDLASIGFDDSHWVLTVNGTGDIGGVFVSTDPADGSIKAGGSQEITVTADASNADPGTYEFVLTIETNVPGGAPIEVPLTVEVLPVVANEDGAIPTAFVVEQNFPNPFASATTIRYGVPSAERVTVAVYDAVGRHVATLVDRDQAAGYYEADWNASAVASGLYVYRIQAGTNVRTLKMMVVR